MKTKFEDKRFNELTEEELMMLSEEEMIDKSLNEYITEINLHVKDIKSYKQHTIGSLLLISILFAITSNFWFLIGLVFTLFCAFSWFKLSKSILWHIRSLKSTSSMYANCGFSFLVKKNLRKVSESINLGELYNI